MHRNRGKRILYNSFLMRADCQLCSSCIALFGNAPLLCSLRTEENWYCIISFSVIQPIRLENNSITETKSMSPQSQKSFKQWKRKVNKNTLNTSLFFFQTPFWFSNDCSVLLTSENIDLQTTALYYYIIDMMWLTNLYYFLALRASQSHVTDLCFEIILPVGRQISVTLRYRRVSSSTVLSDYRTVFAIKL